MLFWDEYFGWDWHGIRSTATSIIAFCAIMSFIATTEGYRWFAPYSWMYDKIIVHATASLILVMLFLSGLFWYWRFQSGDY
jgi:hypothetical protein